jgi:hypothetical protein
METKRCRGKGCGEILPVAAFYVRAASKDGLTSRCKTCCRAESHNRRENLRVLAQTKAMSREISKSGRVAEVTAIRRLKRNPGRVVEITVDELVAKASEVKHCPICEEAINWDLMPTGRITLARVYAGPVVHADSSWIICPRCGDMLGDMCIQGFTEYCQTVGTRFADWLEGLKAAE